MKLLAVVVVAACGGGLPHDGPASAPPGAGRVVVVSVDGMMPDAYLDPGAHGLAIPTLRSLVARGAAARVRGVMPTVTYPSYTTMVTGVPPRIHVLDPARQGEIDAAIAELGPTVARRIDHDELVALGGDPHASFALVAAPRHGFSDKRTGEVIAAIPPHGNHGWPPSDPAMAASLIAFGPAVPHVSLGTIDMLDIAPTIARWLGVALPSATGHPIAALAPGVGR